MEKVQSRRINLNWSSYLPDVRIKQIELAYADTIILVTHDTSRQRHAQGYYQLLHIDAEGKILLRRLYQAAINIHVLIFDSSKIIVSQVKQSIHEILDLQTKQVRGLEHKMKTMFIFQLRVFSFYHTNIIVIVEKGKKKILQFNEWIIQATYYQCPFPFLTWEYLNQVVTQSHQHFGLSKVNNHSKIAVSPYNSNVLKIQFFQLDRTDKIYEFSINVDPHFFPTISIKPMIIDVWELEPNIYMTVVGNRQTYRIGCRHKCIVDASKSQLQPTLKNIKHTEYYWPREGLKDSFHYKYYIQIKDKEGNFVKELAPLNNQGKDFVVPSRDRESLIGLDYRRYQGQYFFVINKLKVIPIQDICLMFLLHLNDDLDDDDLLQEAIQLI